MTNTHQTTPEEEAYERLLDENWDALSESARCVITEAHAAAYKHHLVSNVCFMLEEYEEALEKMRLAAADVTDRGCELLMELARRAIAAAASVDLFDEDTLVGYGTYRRDLHGYYQMVSDMIRDALYDKWRRKRSAEEGRIDFDNVPF